MKRFLAIGLIALSLGACATIKNPITNSQLATIESSYGVVLSGAVAYRNRPRCTKTALESVSNICARRSIVLRMQAADRTAQVALGRARAFVTNNPTLDASSLLQAAQDAVSIFAAIQTGAL